MGHFHVLAAVGFVCTCLRFSQACAGEGNCLVFGDSVFNLWRDCPPRPSVCTISPSLSHVPGFLLLPIPRPCHLFSRAFSWAPWAPLLWALLLTPPSQHWLPFFGHTHLCGACLDSGLEGPCPCRCAGRQEGDPGPGLSLQRSGSALLLPPRLGEARARSQCSDMVESSPARA